MNISILDGSCDHYRLIYTPISSLAGYTGHEAMYYSGFPIVRVRINSLLMEEFKIEFIG